MQRIEGLDVTHCICASHAPSYKIITQDDDAGIVADDRSILAEVELAQLVVSMGGSGLKSGKRKRLCIVETAMHKQGAYIMNVIQALTFHEFGTGLTLLFELHQHCICILSLIYLSNSMEFTRRPQVRNLFCRPIFIAVSQSRTRFQKK
jgi:hypothetical protein